MKNNKDNLSKQLISRITTQQDKIEALQICVQDLENMVKKLKKKQLSGFSSSELFFLSILRFLRLK